MFARLHGSPRLMPIRQLGKPLSHLRRTVSLHGRLTGESACVTTLTRRLLHAAQPERDFVCLLRFRHEMPFISDRSGARPLLRLDDGVTTKMDSSACGTSLRGIESLSGGYTREDHMTDRSTGLKGTGEVYFRGNVQAERPSGKFRILKLEASIFTPTYLGTRDSTSERRDT